MRFEMSIISDSASAPAWAGDLKAIAGELGDFSVEVCPSTRAPDRPGVFFIDESEPGLDEALNALPRGRHAVFLVTASGDRVPEALSSQKVDDVLVHPFRPVEVLSKLRTYQQILMWEEVSRLNDSFSELIERLHEDLRLAERLQKAGFPERFPEVKGFDIRTRYLAGVRSGGDYFDVADAGTGGSQARLSLVLTDSSSYGLSGAVLSALMRVAVKLSADQAQSSVRTVRRIYSDLLQALGETDRLSMFYGVISRKDLVMNYLNLGSVLAFHAPEGKDFAPLPGQGDALTRSSGTADLVERTVELGPGDRLVLVSDGFSEYAGGAPKLLEMLGRYRGSDSKEMLTELLYSVKKGLDSPDALPAQDCTAAVIDVHDRVVRLART